MPLYRINGKLIFFVHIPKTGGSSIESELARVGRSCFSNKPGFFRSPAQHLHAEMYEELIPSSFYDKGITVCRNPYTRLISEYRHQIVRGCFRWTDFDQWALKTFRKYKKEPFLYNNHIRPQTEFIGKEMDVFKFEDGLTQVVQRIYDFCGVSTETRVPNIKLYEKKNIMLKYSTVQQIQRFYRNDFDTFGYDPSDMTFVQANQIILI